MKKYLLIIAFLLSSQAWATDYYLSTTGDDGYSCAQAQSPSTPKATFGSVWSCLSAGDTLSVADGTYTTVSPPIEKAGSEGNVILVQAENDGGAILSGGVTLRANSYIEFVGFKFTASISALAVWSNNTVGGVSHHLTFRRVAFQCSDTVSNGACVTIYDGTHHVLIEDFWAWGGGRYTVGCYGGDANPNLGCDYNTFRRGVIRQGPDTSSSGAPQAGLSIYYASNNIVENVIVLDSIPRSNSSNSAFYITGHAPPPNTNSNKFYGIIALNNEGVGWYLDQNGVASYNELRNSVIWGSLRFGAFIFSGTDLTCDGTIIDHSTIAYTGTYHGLGVYCANTTVTSNIFLSNTEYGIVKGVSDGSFLATPNWNNFYGNVIGPRLRVDAGDNDITSDPELKYILRTEAGTSCKGAGEGGTDCGADIEKRYEDGVLTATDLWPWPYETRIHADMCASTPPDPVNNWCSSGKSLTNYIWGYLGNDNSIAVTKLGYLQQPTSVNDGYDFSPVITTQSLDSNGAVVGDGTPSVTLTASASTITGTNPRTAVAGVATFTGLGMTTPNVGVTLTAAAAGLTSIVSDTFDVADSGIFPTTHFVFSGLPASPIPGASFTLTITAKKADESTDTAYAGTVVVSSSDASANIGSFSWTNGVGTGTVALKTAGSRTFTATDTPNSIVSDSPAVAVPQYYAFR